jgi:hypothetical protein
MIVFAHLNRSFSRLHFHRNDLLRKNSGVLRALGLLLRSQCVVVLFFTRDFKLAREVFRRACHRRIAIRVEQCHHQTVFQFSLSECESGSRATNDVRRLRHRFHSANQTRTRFAKLNHLRA